MGQFDVHLNQGRTRASVPFVLVIQSDRYEATTHRVVVPLVLRAELRSSDGCPDRSGQIAGGESKTNHGFHVLLVFDPICFAGTVVYPRFPACLRDT